MAENRDNLKDAEIVADHVRRYIDQHHFEGEVFVDLARQEDDWIYLPVWIEAEDAWTRAGRLQEVEDAWNWAEPRGNLKLMLVPAKIDYDKRKEPAA